MILRITILLIFCIGCAMGNNLYAQTSWDSSYRPDIYQARVDLFRAMPSSKNDLVFIGDSITFWGDWLELLGNKRVKNRGIPGDTSFGLLQRLGEAVYAKPAAIFIMIGINDLARGIPSRVLLNNYKRMLDSIRLYSPATKVYFQSLLPVNASAGSLTSHYKRAAEVLDINAQLKSWAEAAAVEYIDLVEVLSDESGRLKNNFTWDGVHLTVEGYQAWLNVLKSHTILKSI